MILARGLAAAGAVTMLVLWAGPAGAEVDGACSASVAGVDVTDRSASDPGDAVDVGADARVEVEATSQEPITGYEVKLEFAGIRWTVAEGSATGRSWTRTVDVGTYSKFGKGLYKVVGVSRGQGACTGAALVKVDGNGLLTPAGAAGAVLTGAGLAGMAITARGARR